MLCAVESFEPYPSLALAVMAGMLIGLEREHSRPPGPEGGRSFVGGIRTYPLLALIGGTAALLTRSMGPWPLVVSGLGVIALVSLTWVKDAGAGHLGLTTEASALLTFLLGALALTTGVIEPLSRRVFVVSAISVTVTVLLSSKTQLREFSTRISRDDVIATLKFLIVAVVVLPVLPNEALGPWGVLNPFRIGLMVALIAGIGFVGYVAMRLWGQGRGLLVTAAIGGLASSTAVTLSSAARARQNTALAPLAALAVLIASSIMFLRVMGAVFVVERSLFVALVLPLGLMAGTCVGLAIVFAWHGRGQPASESKVELINPFELSSALKFGALVVAIMLISRWASETFGAGGTYVTGALAGLADVDAITLTMANGVKSHELPVTVAARTIVLAVSSNTVVKGLMAITLGGRAMGVRVLVAFAVVLAVGALAIVV
jgi:uncharacterized membrane protein (DUF4010 family)